MNFVDEKMKLLNNGRMSCLRRLLPEVKTNCNRKMHQIDPETVEKLETFKFLFLQCIFCTIFERCDAFEILKQSKKEEQAVQYTF